MLILTVIVLNSEIALHFFCGGSVESTMKLFISQKIITVILFLIALLTFIVLKNKIKPFLVIFSLVFILWFLSGRTIGVHWTGKVTHGWFYCPIGQFDISDLNAISNIDLNTIEVTTIKRCNFWTIELINGNKIKLFAGPFIISDLEDYFSR